MLLPGGRAETLLLELGAAVVNLIRPGLPPITAVAVAVRVARRRVVAVVPVGALAGIVASSSRHRLLLIPIRPARAAALPALPAARPGEMAATAR